SLGQVALPLVEVAGGHIALMAPQREVRELRVQLPGAEPAGIGVVLDRHLAGAPLRPVEYCAPDPLPSPCRQYCAIDVAEVLAVPNRPTSRADANDLAGELRNDHVAGWVVLGGVGDLDCQRLRRPDVIDIIRPIARI